MLTAFLFGGACYYLIEIIWNGKSDIVMGFAGGLSFMLLHMLLSTAGSQMSLALKYFSAAVIITAVEFTTGYILNIYQGRKLWDYSDLTMNVMGQICIGYSFVWGLLGVPIAVFSFWLNLAFSSAKL